MRRIGSDVKKLDTGVFIATLSRLSVNVHRIRQIRETWNFRFWGVRASREHVETTTELADEASSDRS